MPKRTCVVADDHPLVRQAVADLLSARARVEVVATVRDGVEALAAIEEHEPALAVLDATMPGLDGLEVTRRLAGRELPTAILVYTACEDPALATEALDAGAKALVLKEAPVEDLLRAIEVVVAGGTFVDPTLAAHVARQREPLLTKREREVLRLLADGYTNGAAGKELFLASETVRAHVQRAMRKLGASTRTEAVAVALRRSLIA